MKLLPNRDRWTWGPIATNPAPASAPVSACVVETGSPASVASSTVTAAPSAAALTNVGDASTASGTNPFAENVFTRLAARTSASSEPASVVAVAQASDFRYEALPEP